MREERFDNSLVDNGLGGFAESGKKWPFLRAREVAVAKKPVFRVKGKRANAKICKIRNYLTTLGLLFAGRQAFQSAKTDYKDNP